MVDIGDQKIKFPSAQDAQYVCAISEAVEQYVLHCNRSVNEFLTLHALILLVAIKNNYPLVVKHLLQEKELLRDEHSMAGTSGVASTPLSTLTDSSCSNRLWQEAKQLASSLVQGMSPSRTKSHTPLFFWAVEEQHNAVAGSLMQHKGKVLSETDIANWISLHHAARAGRLEIVQFICSEDPTFDINSTAWDGCTPLELAAGNGHTATVAELLTRGAKVNHKSDLDRSALQRAAAGGHNTITNYLIKAGAYVNAAGINDESHTALQEAAKGGHKVVVETLLKAGADVNARAPQYGHTAIQAAALGGHEAIVDTLLNAGADINANIGSFGGHTALQAAAGHGHEAIVKKLLAAGAQVDAPPASQDGRDALQTAAGNGYEAIVQRLLAAGAHVNALPTSSGGRTALQAAAEHGYQAIAQMLLAAGADVNASPANNAGRTALQAAAGNGQQAMVRMLLAAGAHVNAWSSGKHDHIRSALGNGKEALVHRVFSTGAHGNTWWGKQYEQRTALQTAAENGHEVVVQLLLNAGAYVDAPGDSNSGGTALVLATRNRHSSVVELLRQAGARV